jgi:hypothetical protein
MIDKPLLGEDVYLSPGIADGLVGSWSMNEGTGNKIFDLSGNGNTGTFQNDTLFISGKYGPAIDADGVGDYVSFDKALSFSNPNTLSIVVWVNVKTSTGRETILGHDNEASVVQLEVNSSDQSIDILIPGVFVAQTGNGVFTVGQLHQFVYTRSGTGAGTHAIYVDGISQTLGTDAADNFSQPANSPELFRRAAGSQEAAASISQLYVYNRALTASEIALLYREPFIMFERETIELWAGALGAPPAGNAGIMTTNTGFWGATY